MKQLRASNAELERELSRHSGNSGEAPSSDTMAQRAAEEEGLSRAERRRRAGGKAKELTNRAKDKRRPRKQPGNPWNNLEMVEVPIEIVAHAPLPARWG